MNAVVHVDAMSLEQRKSLASTMARQGVESLPANHPTMVHRRLDGRIDLDEARHAAILKLVRRGNDV